MGRLKPTYTNPNSVQRKRPTAGQGPTRSSSHIVAPTAHRHRAATSVQTAVSVNPPQQQAVAVGTVPIPDDTPPPTHRSPTSAFADQWVLHRSRSRALASPSSSAPVPSLSSPTKEWWAAHPSGKIKHRVYAGSRDDAISPRRQATDTAPG